MKVFLLRAIATAVGFSLAALTTVFAAQYAQEFHGWFVTAMSWGEGDTGYIALAVILGFAVTLGGILLLLMSIFAPLDFIKDVEV